MRATAMTAERNGHRNGEVPASKSGSEVGFSLVENQELDVLAGMMCGLDDDRVSSRIFRSAAARLIADMVIRFRAEMGCAPPPAVLDQTLDTDRRVPEIMRPEVRRWLNDLHGRIESPYSSWQTFWPQHVRLLVEEDRRRRVIGALEAARQQIENGEDLSILDSLTFDPVGSKPRFTLHAISSREFATSKYEVRWHVDNILVRGQPAVIGGAAKSLKTSLAIDLAISVSTGTPFLNEFKATQGKVGIISGESGPATLQETALRVCDARNIDLADTGIEWCFDVPQLTNPEHSTALREFISSNGIELLILDPLYLVLLSEATAGNASNVYAMGSALREVGQLAGETGCTLVLVHHLARGSARAAQGKPAGLDALAQAGLPEFVRQWLILSRRAEYTGDGFHPLWMQYGGSAGHGGLNGLDVREGRRSDLGGRRWAVTVRNPDEIEGEAEDLKDERQESRRAAKFQKLCRDVLEFLSENGAQTVRVIREKVGSRDAVMKEAIPHLTDEGHIEPIEATKARQTVTTFQITEAGRVALETSEPTKGGREF